MSDKKNVGRKALDEENLENVSGGSIQKVDDGYVVSPDYYSGLYYEGLNKHVDTLEEAEKLDRNWNPQSYITLPKFTLGKRK